ncbi:hypothetical protein [Hyphomonas sp.]|uniref:hypothetical protein n=1 Tax=Hyphomonas sp. TaxID=87 RepID=UPI000C893BCD|nr:hypothetical protein [Hyphomonas sp.]MAL45814.1 hypothetical protein [Hyphomonas sp.]
MTTKAAQSFKTLNAGDSIVTRNLLHEAIPITGTIVSGTYNDENIKEFSHGMFQSVYDYPFLSSSANHIFDLTCGYSANSVLSGTGLPAAAQQDKKINIYNEMAQVLVGFDENGSVREFDEDGDLTGGTKLQSAYFFNFTRLLSKDEIKKGSFTLSLGMSGAHGTPFGGAGLDRLVSVTDYSGSSGYKVNSPAGEYGILYATGSALVGGDVTPDANGRVKAGLLYYQAGVAVLTSSLFQNLLGTNAQMSIGGEISDAVLTGSSINLNADTIRHRINNISFNNTVELNSTVYFCRVNNTDFNYSANQTYLSSSKMVVKTKAEDMPVSYVTSVGLYSPDNELLAVAKLSEPLKKDPSTEFTIRVRLDY